MRRRSFPNSDVSHLTTAGCQFEEDTPMSIPTNEAGLKDYLLSNDDLYRELAAEHRRFEVRLNELAALPFPSEDEQVEQTVLKKKKLLLKDRMEAIVSRHKASAMG